VRFAVLRRPVRVMHEVMVRFTSGAILLRYGTITRTSPQSFVYAARADGVNRFLFHETLNDFMSASFELPRTGGYSGAAGGNAATRAASLLESAARNAASSV
jgi:hypothetical protein